MLPRYAFVFGIYIIIDVFYSIWTYTKYNSLKILMTACVSIICQYWCIFLDVNCYILFHFIVKYNSFSPFLLEIYFSFNILPYNRYTMNTAYRHLHLFLLEKSMSLSKQKIHMHLHLTDFVALLSKSWSIFYSPK